MTSAHGSSAKHFAGWLVADVMVLLFVVGMSVFSQRSDADDDTAAVDGSMTTSSSPTSSSTLPETTSTPTTTTTTTAPPAGVEQQPFCLSIGPEADAVTEVATVLARRNLDDRMAGLVLSFGIASDPGPGRALARAANTRLREVPSFASAPMRSFWDTSGPSGGVNIEVYFLTAPGRELPATSCPWIGA